MDSALRSHTGRPGRAGLFLLVLALALASVSLTWRGETRLLASITARVRFDDTSSHIVNPRVEARSTSTTSVGEERERESTDNSSHSSKTASFSVDGAMGTHRRASKLRRERPFAVNGKAQFSCYVKHACVSFPRQSAYGATPLDPPYVAKVTLFGDEELLTQAGLERGVVYAVDPVQSTSGDYSAGVSYGVVRVDAAMPNDIQYATTLSHVDANGKNREWPIELKGLFTLASYFAAGNWGHMLADNFFGIWTRLRFLSQNLDDAPSSYSTHWNSTSTKRTALVMRNCTTAHPVNLPHTAHLAVPACERHVEVLSRALGVELRALAQGETTCYEHLVIGSPDHLARILHANASDVEGYRDHIIRNIGRDPERKASKNATVFVTKRREDSYSFYDFDNQEEVLGMLRSTRGAENVKHYVITPDTTLEEQIDVFLNASTLVCPGGGVGFSSFFLAKDSHLIIWPYPGGGHEEKQFTLSAKWLRKVDIWVPQTDPVQNLDPAGPLPHFVYKSKYPTAEIKRLLDEGGRR